MHENQHSNTQDGPAERRTRDGPAERETRDGAAERVAWVIGGSAGLGFSIAKALRQADYRVVIFARDPARLLGAVEQWQIQERAAGDPGRRFPENDFVGQVLDAADPRQVARVFQERFAIDMRLDVLVNVVGKSCRTTLQNSQPEIYRQMMEANFFPAIHTTLTALPWLVQSRGTVVNIASLAAKTAWPWVAPYAAAKSAMASFHHSLRIEMAGKIHTLLVCPGPIARNDVGMRYEKEMESGGNGEVDSAREFAGRPGAGAPVTALDPDRLAQRIVMAIDRQQPELILPWKSRLLFIVSACSPRWGDWLLRRLAKT